MALHVAKEFCTRLSFSVSCSEAYCLELFSDLAKSLRGKTLMKTSTRLYKKIAVQMHQQGAILGGAEGKTCLKRRAPCTS